MLDISRGSILRDRIATKDESEYQVARCVEHQSGDLDIRGTGISIREGLFK